MYRQEEPDVNLEKLIARFKSIFGRFGGKGRGIGPVVLLVIIGVAVGIWAASGFFTVQPGEKAALKMFGAYSDTKDTGLRWWWPSPVGGRDIIKVDEVKKLELGVRGSEPVLDESLMITGDADEDGNPGEAPNLVDVQLLVQYDIKNLKSYLYETVSPDGYTLKDATETSLRQVVGSRPIDDVLTDKKEDIQIEI